MCLKEVPLRRDVPTVESKGRRRLTREHNSTLPNSVFIGN